MSHHRQVAIEFALKRAALALLSREIGIREAIAVVTAATGAAEDEKFTPRELVAESHRRYRADTVAEMIRLERDGRGRAAAMIMARLNAADPLDPIERETLANKYRRWLRTEKRANARLAASR